MNDSAFQRCIKVKNRNKPDISSAVLFQVQKKYCSNIQKLRFSNNTNVIYTANLNSFSTSSTSNSAILLKGLHY